MRCYIITKAKRVKMINIRESRPYLIYGEGVYKLDGKKVNLSYKEGKINPTPELLYFENDPIPYDSTGEEEATEEKLVRDTFLKNFFESTSESGSKSRFGFMGIFTDHWKSWVGISIIALGALAFFMAGGFKGI